MLTKIVNLKPILLQRGPLALFLLVTLAYGLFLGPRWNQWNVEHKRTKIHDFFHSSKPQAADELRTGRTSTTGAIVFSKCAAESGKFMVICNENDQFDRYDNVNFMSADDIGSAFFITLDSALRGKPARYTDSARINFTLNVTAFVIMAIILYNYFGVIAASLFYLATIPIAINFMTFQHSAHAGAAILVILPSLVLFDYHKKQRLDARISFLFIGSLGLFAVGSLWRQSIGYMGFVTFAFLSFALFFNNKRSLSSFFIALSSTILVYIATKADKLINFIASLKYNLLEARYVGHGFSQTLVAGIGEVKNIWGLTYHDADGARIVNPNYVTPTEYYKVKFDIIHNNEFYNILRDYYFKLVIDHPFEIIRIYLHKLYLTLIYNDLFIKLPFRFFALTIAVLVIYRYYRLIKPKFQSDTWFKYSILCLTMMLFFVAQSVFATMRYLYFLPFWIFFAIFLCVTLTKFCTVTLTFHGITITLTKFFTVTLTTQGITITLLRLYTVALTFTRLWKLKGRKA